MGLITWVLSIIPGLPIWPGPDAGNALTFVLNELAQGILAWNHYVALNLLVVLATYVILPAEITSAVWKGVRWLLTHLPWVGGAEGSGE